VRREEWETEFCVPFYRGGYRDTNTAYWGAHAAMAGAGEDLLGIYVVTPRARWAGMNLAFVSEPVFDLPGLRQRIERAGAYYRERRLGWTLIVCEDWVAPDLRDAVSGLCRELSFSVPVEAYSMTGRMEPQPAPHGLEIRRVTTQDMRREFADINAEAWNVPVEWTREILENHALWDGRMEGYVGYVGDEGVATAMVSAVDSMSYLSWVATRAAHRRQGYASALARNAGGPDCLLIASPMGLPFWRRMGLATVSKFSIYVSGDKTD
jgi:GNAT superfamily N-acetyltransferase